MNIEFKISQEIDLSPFEKFEGQLDDIFEKLQGVVRDTGDILKEEWVKEASIALKNPGGYVQRVRDGLIYPYEANPLHLIIVNDHPAVIALEEGYGAFSMKRGLLSGKHVKIGKDGKRYIIVPFKHSQGGLQKAGIDLGEVKGLQESIWKTRGQDIRPPQKHQYEWGGKLTDMGDVGKQRKYFSGIGEGFASQRQSTSKFFGQGMMYKDGKPHASTVDYTWKASPFENLHRFTVGGKTHDLTTFRTMSENSPEDSWIHPGIRAMHIAQNARNTVDPIFQDKVADILREGLGKLFK